MREVFVVGVGMTKFGRFPDKEFTDLGREAIVNALKDANMQWGDVQTAYCGRVFGDQACGHNIVAQVGLTGIPVVNVENSCSSGGSAFRLAFQEVAGGFCDVAIAFGFEKLDRGFIPLTDYPPWQRQTGLAPQPVGQALLARRHMEEYGTTVEQIAKVVVKNRKNACHNPYAHFQQKTTMEEVLNSRMICDPLTLFMCCPTSDGAAAAIFCCKDKVSKYTTKPIKVAAVVLRSGNYGYHGTTCFFKVNPGIDPPTRTEIGVRQAYEMAGCGPEDLDLIELHDAFASDEIILTEQLGICGKGEGGRLIDEGVTEINGRIPVSPSGGLNSRGHALGATCIAQVAEIVWQLRGEAGKRQIPDAKVGLSHSLGAGPNLFITILER